MYMDTAEVTDFVLYIGNLPRGITSSAIRQIFQERNFEVGQIDEKDGFAFVHMKNQEVLDAACGKLKEVVYNGQLLKIESAKGNGAVKRREQARRDRALTPNNTLFVVNFDPLSSEQDLRDEFGKYGSVRQLQINKNYCFVHYETTEEAEQALTNLHGSTIGGRQITVEFSDRSPWTGRKRFPIRRAGSREYMRYDRHSPSPRRRRSPSPGDYYDRRRPSPYYGQSPSPPRFRSARDRVEPYGYREEFHPRRYEMRDEAYGRGVDDHIRDYEHRDHDRRDDHYRR